MSKFAFEAKTVTGQTSKGLIEAKDESEARIKLRSRNLNIISLRSVGGQSSKNSQGLSIFETRIKSKELQIFTRQFSTLINAGIPILDSLRILSETVSDKLLRQTLIAIRASIETGRKLSDSMMQHPRVFDSLYCNMVKAGEEAGILDIILNRLSVYSEKTKKLRIKLKVPLLCPR